MKLYYGPPSPFSRKARVAIVELGLRHRVALVPVRTMDDNPALAALNPLMKVPTLITQDGDALYDSRVICEYLDGLEGGAMLIPAERPARWRVLRRQALADGLMEALIFLRVPARRPRGENAPAAIIERQRQRVERGLDVLEAQVREMEDEGAALGCISAACAIGWLDFNFGAWDWRAGRERLANWYAKFSQRASMIDTAPTRPS
jgi:glutathione S-transferase